MNTGEKGLVKRKAINEVMEKYLRDGTEERIVFAALLENLLEALMKGERDIFAQ
jgi:hypothetical protein